MIEIQNGPRVLQFEGREIGESSSGNGINPRWIEFKLYLTDGGNYIISRVGVSLVFHSASCDKVTKYNLTECSVDDLYLDAVACEECQPTLNAPVVFPEKDRWWAKVCDNAESVVESLHKREGDTQYLTRVAERLLTAASRNDPNIDMAFRVQTID